MAKIYKDVILHFRVTKDDKKKLDRFLKKNKMTLTKFLTYAMKEYINNFEKGEADEY